MTTKKPRALTPTQQKIVADFTPLAWKVARRFDRRGELSEIWKECGYAHQSHMTARFTQVEKLPPMRWLRSEKMRREAAAKQVH